MSGRGTLQRSEPVVDQRVEVSASGDHRSRRPFRRILLLALQGLQSVGGLYGMAVPPDWQPPSDGESSRPQDNAEPNRVRA